MGSAALFSKTPPLKLFFLASIPGAISMLASALYQMLDGIFVGPLDLSIALGCPMELDSPRMRAALERVVAACKAAGKLTMIFCGDTAAAKARLAAGFDSAALGLDVLTLIQSYRAMAKEVRG